MPRSSDIYVLSRPFASQQCNAIHVTFRRLEHKPSATSHFQNLTREVLCLNLSKETLTKLLYLTRWEWERVGMFVCEFRLQSVWPPQYISFLFCFCRQRACLLSLSGTCPSSAVLYRVLWELCDPPAISIHVFVKLFRISRSPFVWLRTLGRVLLGLNGHTEGFEHAVLIPSCCLRLDF